MDDIFTEIMAMFGRLTVRDLFSLEIFTFCGGFIRLGSSYEAWKRSLGTQTRNEYFEASSGKQ